MESNGFSIMWMGEQIVQNCGYDPREDEAGWFLDSAENITSKSAKMCAFRGFYKFPLPELFCSCCGRNSSYNKRARLFGLRNIFHNGVFSSEGRPNSATSMLNYRKLGANIRTFLYHLSSVGERVFLSRLQTYFSVASQTRSKFYYFNAKLAEIERSFLSHFRFRSFIATLRRERKFWDLWARTPINGPYFRVCSSILES